MMPALRWQGILMRFMRQKKQPYRSQYDKQSRADEKPTLPTAARKIHIIQAFQRSLRPFERCD
jgi:hypothetical protein